MPTADDHTPIVAPQRALLPEVLGWLRQVSRLPFSGAAMADLPRGHGEPVLVVPGFMTADLATVALRRALARLGYDVHGWGFGTNRGDVTRDLQRLGELATTLAERNGAPVRLVGWSLGGVLCRGVARRQLAPVHQVVTLGTPVRGGPKYTTVGAQYVKRGYDLDAIEARIEAEVAATPLTVPVTAIYSKSDRVVAWRACIDRHDEIEHVEVFDTTHAGLGFSPAVHRIVALRLAGQTGR